MKDKQAFWNAQAAKGELSGTRDRYAKELEMQVIARYVSDGMRVLDVGCGDGETVLFLADKFPHLAIDGIDYSEEMIESARKKRGLTDRPITFCKQDIRDGIADFDGKYDFIYTQRALINLDSWEEQRQAILDILELLKPSGTYVMVECFQEGLQEINELRLAVGLESIVPPWHNRYFSSEKELYPFLESIWKNLQSYQTVKFSGQYYFMSRVVNAWIAKRIGVEQNININPSYDHPLNHLGTLLPPGCVTLRGQTQAWIIKKKETK